jgi:putative endonuclease
MEKHFFVYILANKTNVAIYIGVTSNLPARIYEHKHHMDPGSFTAKYNITKLVYFEDAGTEPLTAFEREKQLKGWTRAKKNALVNSMNPTWCDLYDTLF